MALYIVKPWYKKQAAPSPIYGAEWAGGSDPSWSRTDDAVGFSAPNPYYSGMSTTPSSPFDNIMPWAGMRRVTDASAGELVEIPKFYYKWTRDGAKMKLQISTQQHTGFLCSPAHADRGDGVGERDYVYVGRYKCASDYTSKTGYSPKVSETRATFRSGIHNLGANIWQNDYAMWWTINMLYLVEFANWDSQDKIGYGCGNGSSITTNGTTDGMLYHTGTTGSSLTTYGNTQYRHIENVWGNVFTWVDGIYHSGYNVYCVKNPSSFSDSSNGALVGTIASSSGYISQWTNSETSGFEYALVPSATSGSTKSYICDRIETSSNGAVFFTGGNYSQDQSSGMFFMYISVMAGDSFNHTGSRLMVLPPSRLT